MAILTFRSFVMPGEGGENESKILLLVSLRTAEDEQLHQVKRMIRGIVDQFSNLKFERSSGYFGEALWGK